MTAVVQAPDLAKMTGDALAVEASNAPEVLKKVYRHAVDNYDRLRTLSPEIDTIHNNQLASERAAGIDTDSIDNYVAQRWDFDTMLGANKPVVLDASGGKGGSSKNNEFFQTTLLALRQAMCPSRWTYQR
jgi:hypothetical protein